MSKDVLEDILNIDLNASINHSKCLALLKCLEALPRENIQGNHSVFNVDVMLKCCRLSMKKSVDNTEVTRFSPVAVH
jgi:hypothetical protein